MSFTTDVSTELLSASLSKTCCRKSMLYGMLFCAKRLENNAVSAEFKTQESAQKAAQILNTQFSLNAEPQQIARAGRRFFVLDFKSKAIFSFLDQIDSTTNLKSIDQIIGFRCADCAHAFLRGVFISSGTANDPNKGYHLEFSVSPASRAKLLRDFLEKENMPSKLIERGAKTGLYYKSSSSVFEVIYYMGGVKSSFNIPNAGLVKELRNRENRATNCVTSNISRAVDASRKQVEAIEAMRDSGGLAKLSRELRYTAELRLNNPSASLLELALMHEPPISKSGLNRRLNKIIEISKIEE